MTRSIRQPQTTDYPAEHAQSRGRTSKFALIVGFVALYVGLVSAYNAPATAYEISIYDATPLAFWAGMAIAMLVALTVSWWVSPENHLRKLALALAVVVLVAIAALPIIRGYFFVGAGDALTHLGWMKDIQNGVLNPVYFLYPGIHTATLFIKQVTGMSLERATEFLVLAYFVSFVLFTGLTVHLIAKTKHALLFGVFSALLVLPINNISVHLQPHPSTEAILYLPLVLYLTVRYLTNTEGAISVGRLSITPSAILLAVALAAILLIHPQVAGNVILIYASIAFLQLVFRQLRSEHAISNHRPLYAHTVYLITIFLLWAPRNPRTTQTLDTIVNAILFGVTETGAIDQRGASLAAIGGSLGELFVKLFFVSAVFLALAALLMGLNLRKTFERSFPSSDGIIKYLTLSMIPLGGMFLLFSLLQGSTQRFRYLGFIMVLITILGAVMLSWAFDRLSQRTSTRTLGTVAVLVFVVLLPLSTMTVFASPYIYQPSQQVTEMQMHGYETAFDYQAMNVPYTGIQAGPERFVHAYYGTPFVNEDDFVPGSSAVVEKNAFDGGTLLNYYDESRYIIFSDVNTQLELDVYKGVRYSEAGFNHLDSTPDIAQVHTNGDVRVYLLHQNTEANQSQNSTMSA
ncbi:hypothetical protein ACFQH3_01400 [Haladaptatus sp. GCM10025707]|uniref:hypothetical protein n=1 Tax=unclassified Haladaptatus TaxID=2622732 RepID=UPI0023E7B716|nr:hypothetical protein [Haladaptatus sp. QDMS2]